MKKMFKQDNFNINVFSTKKFKSTRIHVSFCNDLDKETVTKRALIPYLLRAINQTFKTRSEVSSYLENMYAAQFSVGNNKVGLTHFINFDMSIINDKYTINNEDLFEDSIKFLSDVLLKPLFKQEIMDEEVRLLKEYYLSIHSNKMRLTIKKMQEVMFKDEAYKLSAFGCEEDIDDLTLDDIIEAYQDMINNDLITVSIVGDLDIDDTFNIINKHFTFSDRTKEVKLLEYNPKETIKLKEEIIKADVEQAKLAVGYRFETRFMDDDYYSALVLNSLLGGSSDSLLHKRIREELGLVYFISSSYDFYKGALFVFSGINAKEYDNTLQEITTILKEIQKGNISSTTIEIAKKMIINQMIESHDSNYNAVIRMERKDLFNRDTSLDESIQAIKMVSLKDIMEVSMKIKLDTKVLLKGDKDE